MKNAIFTSKNHSVFEMKGNKISCKVLFQLFPNQWTGLMWRD